MLNPLRIVLILMLFGLLVLVRVFEHELFYDLYLLFFQNDYLYMDFPRRETFKLIVFTTLDMLLIVVFQLLSSTYFLKISP